MGIVDLPEDILAIIFLSLDATSFLAFCQTCRDLYQYRQEPAFWRNLTSSTFRLPVSPLLKADGARWYWLYKRLRTQTTLFTWGQGLKGDLGLGLERSNRRFRRPLVMGRRFHGPVYQRIHSSWPTEVHVPDEVDVISDLQCGGWSTTILSSRGRLYTVGCIDSVDDIQVGESVDQFRKLEYATQNVPAIRQFSSGRRHILGLSDDSEIFSWDRVNAKALKVFSRSSIDFGGRATRVMAGWAEGSAYVPETGLVYWPQVVNDQEDQITDGKHVQEQIVPGTARYVAQNNQVVEVTSHVLLEDWIVWLTNSGKIFATNLQKDSQDPRSPRTLIFEVPGYSSAARTPQDVQGQFRSFAVYTDTGEVLAGSTDYLRLCREQAQANPDPDDITSALPPVQWSRLAELLQSRPTDVPALQHTQVISIAYGDYHYHALHANGQITSLGREPQSCGALGLGDPPNGSRFRGLRTAAGWRPDTEFLPGAEVRGHRVWFEPEKRDWLRHLEESMTSDTTEHASTAESSSAVQPLTSSPGRMLQFSEWVEQEGRHWHEGPTQPANNFRNSEDTGPDAHDFHLDPYFTLAISAAGWHSGALVLVDKEKAEEVRQKWMMPMPHEKSQDDHDDVPQRQMPGHFIQDDQPVPEDRYVWTTEGFPRVILPDGYETSANGTVRPWRDDIPDMSELGLT